MMKKVSIGICALAVAAAIGAGVLMSSASTAEKNSVGAEKALEIALNDAGISKEQAKEKSSVFTKEHGKYVFDVEFDFENREYDYLIGAKDGSIVSREVEAESGVTTTAAPSTSAEPATKKESAASVSESTSAPEASALQAATALETSAQNEQKPSTAQTTTSETTTVPVTTKSAQSYRISATEAKKIALENAGVDASKAKFKKVKLEKDDGIYEYEIEFLVNSKEYEYKINAVSGEIIEKDVDSLNEETTQKATTSAPKPTSGFISIGKAKEIALSHAKLNEKDVTFKKVKLEKDDGVYQYEVEFEKGLIEYEYSINAKDGSIIDFDKEIDL